MSNIFLAQRSLSHGNFQITQTIANIIGFFPQTDDKALFLKVTPTYFIELGEVQLLPKWSLRPIDPKYSWYCEIICMLQEEQDKHELAPSLPSYTGDLSTQ